MPNTRRNVAPAAAPGERIERGAIVRAKPRVGTEVMRACEHIHAVDLMQLYAGDCANELPRTSSLNTRVAEPLRTKSDAPRQAGTALLFQHRSPAPNGSGSGRILSVRPDARSGCDETKLSGEELRDTESGKIAAVARSLVTAKRKLWTRIDRCIDLHRAAFDAATNDRGRSMLLDKTSHGDRTFSLSLAQSPRTGPT